MDQSPPPVVDKVILATKVAAIRDATQRIRTVLPPTADAFLADRTSREVVTLNLFLALQESIALATHWLADEGWDVPQTHGQAFSALAERGVIDAELATRLRAAAGLRTLTPPSTSGACSRSRRRTSRISSASVASSPNAPGICDGLRRCCPTARDNYPSATGSSRTVTVLLAEMLGKTERARPLS